jgi:hypothetical protein
MSAQSSNPFCPKVNVTGPSGVTNPGETMRFLATVDSRSSDLQFLWSVSGGVIESGQGSKEMIVRTSRADAGQNVHAKITVKGILIGCDAVGTESGPVADLLPCGLASDEFGPSLKPNDMKGRLDNFFQELANNPSNEGVILFRFTENEQADRTNPRLELIVKHAKFRKVDLARLVFKFEAREDVYTLLYRVPENGAAPCPECVTIHGRELKQYVSQARM